MLITKTYHDIPSALDPNGRPIRVFVIAPTIPGYPNAKFPGKDLEISLGVHSTAILLTIALSSLPGVVVFRYARTEHADNHTWLMCFIHSEIYQVDWQISSSML